MNSHAYYLIGLVIIYLGIRFVLRGNKAGSKARIMNGAAVAMVGAAQFFRQTPVVAISIIVVALVMFAVSLIMLKREFQQR